MVGVFVAHGVAVMTMIQGVCRGSAGRSVMIGVTPIGVDASTGAKNPITPNTRNSTASAKDNTATVSEVSRKGQNLQIAYSGHNCAGQQNKKRIYQDCFQHFIRPFSHIPTAAPNS